MIRKVVIATVLLAAIIATASLTGCKSKGGNAGAKELGKPVVKIDGLTLYEKDFEIYGQGTQLTPKQKQDFIKQWTKVALLYLAAKEEGFDKDPIVRRRLELNDQFMLVQEYEARKLSSLTVSPQEVDSMYNLYKDLFDRNASFFIVYGDSAKIQQIDKILRNKTGSRLFAAIQQVKADSSVTAFETKTPVNLGIFYLSYEDIPKSLRDKVIKLKEGQGTWGPYQNSTYIYLFMIKENRTSADPQQVKGFINQYLADYKRRAVEDSIISSMEKKYKIEYLAVDTTGNVKNQ